MSGHCSLCSVPFLSLLGVWDFGALCGQGPALSGRAGADCLSVWKRYPDIVAAFVAQLEGVTEAEHLRCAVFAARILDGIQGFEIPSWGALVEGARPPPRDPEDHEPGSQRQGWHEASSRVEREFRDEQLFPAISDTHRALLRSQSGPGAGMFLCTTPYNPLTRLDSFTFRVLFCRRLRLPLPLTKHICRCGRRTDVYGHHRAACAQFGVLAR